MFKFKVISIGLGRKDLVPSGQKVLFLMISANAKQAELNGATNQWNLLKNEMTDNSMTFQDLTAWQQHLWILKSRKVINIQYYCLPTMKEKTCPS